MAEKCAGQVGKISNSDSQIVWLETLYMSPDRFRTFVPGLKVHLLMLRRVLKSGHHGLYDGVPLVSWYFLGNSGIGNADVACSLSLISSAPHAAGWRKEGAGGS